MKRLKGIHLLRRARAGGTIWMQNFLWKMERLKEQSVRRVIPYYLTVALNYPGARRQKKELGKKLWSRGAWSALPPTPLPPSLHPPPPRLALRRKHPTRVCPLLNSS